MNQMTQMNQAQLLHWINMVSFAVVDITEYLDTHPIDADVRPHLLLQSSYRNAQKCHAGVCGQIRTADD